MKEWIQGIFVIGLAICTMMDIRKKQIYAPFVLLWSSLLIVLRSLAGTMSLSILAAAVLVLFIVCGISILTGGQMGMGDGMLLAMSGLGLGVAGNLCMMAYCFLGTFLTAMVLLVFFHGKKESRIPLAPFMLVGSILVIVVR